MCISELRPAHPHRFLCGNDRLAVELVQQRLGVYGHFDLACHPLAQFPAINDGHPVVLRQRCKRVERNANRSFLHDDCSVFAMHKGAGAQPYFFVRWDVVDFLAVLHLLDDAGKVLARHCGDKFDAIGNKVIHDLWTLCHDILSFFLSSIFCEGSLQEIQKFWKGVMLFFAS